MAQGKALSEWQVETVRATWLLTRNGSEAGRAAGCNVATANRYIAAHREELTRLAQDKKPDLADALGAAADRLVSALFDQKRIADAPLVQVATALGIVIDKRQLLTNQPTARVETGPTDPGRLTPEEREQAAKIRAKLAAGATP